MSNPTQEKKTRHLTLGVHYCAAQTSWNNSALIFEDQSGDASPRKVTLKIERPIDIAYIREKLDDIETSWRKELDMLKATS